MRMINDYLNLTTGEALQRVKKEYDAYVVVCNKRSNKMRKPGKNSGDIVEEVEFTRAFMNQNEKIF